MQRNGCKINETHINTIALKARLDNSYCGYLWKRSDSAAGKWQMKWFALYQNFLFYYENVNSTKPLGLILLESCYCNRIVANTKNTKEGDIKLFCFSISYTKDGKNCMEFGAENEDECIQWIDSIKNCSYNRQASQYAEFQQKYIHLSQLYETESKSKWKYLAQIEELSKEVKELREELKRFKKQHHLLRSKTVADEESDDMRRIKKVQSLCKGWLYRRRWQRIVKEYIESPHAHNLRKRNHIVVELIEKEGEYMTNLEILVSNFLRPFKMAACSSKAPITHEEINCIFLNSEILLFLHQIFYKGLTKKLENWPTLFVGDLFDFLLPVLVIYQEYVRNHHYSLQILTDLKSKSIEFRTLLKRYEEKSRCESRSLDVFLTYPMHQIPRYILILHQLIAHTSHNSTNELKSLENAKTKLEELSKTMHDEVSETENIRCNLAIEKMIVEGCECLLDANQVFIREGLLIVLTCLKSKTLGVKLKDVKKRNVVKCFLFTNHLIVTTRASNGRLNLFKPYEAIPLSECKIIEEVTNDPSLIEDENASIMSDDHSISSASVLSTESTSSLLFSNNKDIPTDTSCEFKLIQTNNTMHRSIHFIASSIGEKQAWCSDISQCLDNLNYSSLLQNTNTSNSVNMPNKATLMDDPKLFKDEKDVKYCKALNSCKVPQIRQATVEKLIERLTDLRFLSIDFLNTFLLTYRVFIDPFVVLNALISLYESSPRHSMDLADGEVVRFEVPINNELSRRISVADGVYYAQNKGIYRLPSINEEQDVVMRHRNSHSCAFRRDIKIDINEKDEDEEALKEQKANESAKKSIKEEDTEQVDISATNKVFSNSFSVNKQKEEHNDDASISPGAYSLAPSNAFKSLKMAPIASCETIETYSSNSNCSSKNNNSLDEEEHQNNNLSKLQIRHVDSSTTTNTVSSGNKSNAIENVLNNAKKISVSDGIVNLKSDPKLNVSSIPLTASFINENNQQILGNQSPTTDNNEYLNDETNTNCNNYTNNNNNNNNVNNNASSPTTPYPVSNNPSNVNETNGADTDNDDSEDEAPVKLNRFHSQPYGSRNNSKDYTSSNSSLNGSISSATSAASRLSYWKDSMEPVTNKRIASANTTEALSLSPAMGQRRLNLYSKDKDNNNIVSTLSKTNNNNSSNNSSTNSNRNSKNLNTNQLLMAVQQNAQKISKRLSDAFTAQKLNNKLVDAQNRKLPISVYAGVVVTSSRSSRRRISNTEATRAFAVATSGSQNSLDSMVALGQSAAAPTNTQPHVPHTVRFSLDSQKIPFHPTHRVDRVNSAEKTDWVIVNTAASMRVLNVLRHWITKHPLDFDENDKLKEDTLNLIHNMLNDGQITDTEKKVAQYIIQQLNLPIERKLERSVNIELLLAAPTVPGKVRFCDLSVSEIAEQMTYIDYQIFCSISSQELLGQAWMKPGKENKAPNVLVFSKRFNEMSQLVVSEIVTSTNPIQRLEKLEKWTTIANICKFLKNFNGVLQIMSAFASTSVFRLKKTWEKLSKNSQQTIDTLQNLVSSDGRFKNLRDAMVTHKCDPPCIPYLGMYLMDLAFIEESMPDFLDGNLINFSKLRMVSHIIRDIRTFQHSKYTIHHNRKVCEYLLDTSGLLTPDEAYDRSLSLEPRTSLLKRLER